MSKTFYNLYPRVCDPDNLWQAYRQAARGKRMQPTVAAFEYDLEAHLLNLEQELRARTYTPGGYYNFIIGVPKRRLISAAPFRDRVVHHALMNVIEPLFERQFIYDSYANRQGKGTHRALDRCTYWMRRYRYVMHCDVRQYFPSVDYHISWGQPLSSPCPLLSPQSGESRGRWEEGCRQAAKPPAHTSIPLFSPSPRRSAAWGARGWGDFSQRIAPVE